MGQTNYYLAIAPSIEIFEELFSYYKDNDNGGAYIHAQIRDIVNIALNKANYPLANYLIKKYNVPLSQGTIYFALESKDPISLKFVEKYILPKIDFKPYLIEN